MNKGDPRKAHKVLEDELSDLVDGLVDSVVEDMDVDDWEVDDILSDIECVLQEYVTAYCQKAKLTRKLLKTVDNITVIKVLTKAKELRSDKRFQHLRKDQRDINCKCGRKGICDWCMQVGTLW